jgi:uncharacterized protein
MAKGPHEEFKSKYGEWALVAGAAEGIGEGFSEELAKKGVNLVMIDFNGNVLHNLSEKLKERYKIETREIVLDLTQKDSPEICIQAIVGLDCRLLIYIPAYSRVKPFLSHQPEELDNYINLNARTPLHLVHSFILAKKDEKSTGILLMASLAGLIGSVYLAPYSATKAFSILLAESLGSEYSNSNFYISVCCAGQTSTPAYWSSKPSSSINWPPVMDPGKVAEYALRKLGRKTILIPGWQNRISFFILSRILPRSLSAGIFRRSMKRIYPAAG